MHSVGADGALDSAQHANDKCRRLQEWLDVFLDATRAFAGAATDSQHLLQTLARRVAESIKDCCVVLLLSDDGLSLIPVATFDPDPETLHQLNDALLEPLALEAHPVTRAVIESGESLFLPRLDLARFRARTTPRSYDFMQRIGMHSLMLVPLRIHDRSIGQLVLARFRADSPAFDEHDLGLAQGLANHAALAIDNARSLVEARRETAERKRIAERLRFLADASGEFSAATLDLDRLLEVVARRLGECVGDMCSIRVITEDGQWLETDGATYHREPEQLSALRAVALLDRQRVGEGISGRVAATGQTLFAPRIEPSDFASSTGPEYQPFLDQLKVTSAITLPLICRGKLIGVANLFRSRPGHPYDDEDLRFVQDLAEHAALAIGNARCAQLMHDARAADSTLRSLLEVAPDAMVVVDRDGRVILINAETERLFGYAREELLGQTVELLLPERFRGAHPAHRKRYFSVPSVRAMGSGIDLWGRRKDGTEFPIEIALSPLETKDGIRVAGAIRELTQQKLAEEQLRRAKDIAEAASRELEAFSYAVAHDLRAPLRAISGYSTALVEDLGGNLDASARGYLDRICAGAVRMSLLIDALLGLARLARTELVRESVDLNELAHATIAQLRAGDPSRAVEFAVSEGLHALGHPRLLRSLLDNLLGNAWKFTGECKAARIELGQTPPEGGGAYFVRDNGAGFDMRYAGKLFAPFQRLHAVEAFPGTGIGLATVQRIVRLHGGEIRAEAEVGSGATFYFTLDATPREPR